MVPRKGPTLRAQWLGRQLRELREAARLTLRDAGDHIQRDPAAVSRLENGITPGRAPDVLALLDLYGVTDTKVRDGLEQLSRDIWQKGWWDGYAAEATGRVIDHAWLESRATGLRSYDAMVVPGLLQTHEYAEAVITAADPTAEPAYVARWAEFRMKRQQVLNRPDPLRLEVILDEALLHRAVGGETVMRRQLEHLKKMAERPAVVIRVLPFSVGAHSSLRGPFTIFDLPSPYPDVAYTETPAGNVYVEAEGVEDFCRAYDDLHQAALSPDDSTSFIAARVKQLT